MKLKFILCKLLFCGITVSLLIAVGIGLAYGQKVSKCKSADKVRLAPSYRVGNIYRTVKSETAKIPPTLVVYISIKPQYFNSESMKALAQQLNKDYCKEQLLEVIIFSNYRAARDFTASGESPTYERSWAAMRGGYHLNRATGEEYISYSPDPNKPREEVKIVISAK
jgi:hypothetical protein